MQRDGDVIRYSDQERLDFNVPFSEHATTAVITAHGLHRAAEQIQSNLVQRLDSPNKDSVSFSRSVQYRAGELARFASQVFELCPDEHLALILTQSQ